jgi:ER lumen protein retaining receptor
MKIFYLASSFGTVYLIYFKFKATYDKTHDTFRVEFLLIPSAILALVINHDFDVLEILWTFSIYLESVAILPQLFMVSKTGEIKTPMKRYLVLMASYRALCIINWIYRYFDEGFIDYISFGGGTTQVLVYLAFFLRFNSLMMKSEKHNKISSISIISEANFLDSHEKIKVLGQFETFIEHEKKELELKNEDIACVIGEPTKSQTN